MNETKKRQARFFEESGLTLIELMIAAGILAVAFVMLLEGIVSISSTNAITENRTQASAQVASVIDELQSLSFEQLLAYQPPAMRGLGSTSRLQVVCIGADGGAIAMPVNLASLSGSLPNPLEVQVTAIWNDRQGRLSTTRASTFCRR